MRIPYTQYTFREPAELSEILFLAARHHPAQIRAQYRRAAASKVGVTTFRIAVVIAIVYWGPELVTQVQEGGWNVTSYMLVLTGFIIGGSCTLSALSYLGYVMDSVLYWEDLLGAAKRHQDLGGFRREVQQFSRQPLPRSVTT
jgi:hypothetical protein